MYNSKSPYFSMAGLAFREANTPFEMTMNLRIGLEKIRSYVLFGGSKHEAWQAMLFIEENCPKVQTITNDMRLIIFEDDRFPDANLEKLKKYRLQLCNDLDRRTKQNSPARTQDD